MPEIQTQEEIHEARKQIIEELNKAIGNLKEAREKCRFHSFWDLGTDAKTLEDLIDKTDQLAKEFTIPTPEIRD